MTRVIGPPRSRRRRWTLLWCLVAAVGASMFFISGALAVHDENLFELGPTSTACNTSPPGSGCTASTATNILGDGSTANGPDWADLFNASGKIPGALSTFGGIADAFIADASSAGGASDPSTFSGFGTSNKNTDPVSTADCTAPGNSYPSCTPWGWASGNIPAKDDLTNVYAYETQATATQTLPDKVHANDLILYVGAEREDPSGDSHIDFEFFQNQVGLCTTTGCSTFTGVREAGDVVLSMDFLKGGGLGSVTVRRWSGSDYLLEGTAAGVGCTTDDTICAFNNEVAIDGGPWQNFDNHGKEITNLDPNAFTEIGVDLTQLIGASPCLATFMGKTRSSGSFTSELKDFAGPVSFAPCVPHTTLTKTPSATKVENNAPVTYTYTEVNDGQDPINLTSETDDKCSPVAATLKADGIHNIGDTNNNGILDVGETWTFTCTVAHLTATTTNTATFVGTDTLSGTSLTETAQATVTVIHPATTLLKQVSATVTPTYTYKETNTGDDDLSGVSVSDDKCSSPTLVSGDNNNDGKLNPGETWTFTCTGSAITVDTDPDTTTIPLSATSQNTATGHGTDSLTNPVPATGETDKTTVNVSVSHP
jgi:hypothetical protein